MSEATNGSGIREHVLLFSRFLRSPRTVGALAPSSQALARAVADELRRGSGRRVVELGPGTGALTAELMRRLKPEDRFLAVDIDPEFVRELQGRWPALEFVCGSAARLSQIAADHGMAAVDHVISGLPFSTLPAEVTRQVLDSVGRTLRPGGLFTTFQYAHAYHMSTSAAFRREMTATLGARPARRLIVRNVPPCFVLTWQRSASASAPPGGLKPAPPEYA